MPHMPVSFCEDTTDGDKLRPLCQYTSLLWGHCNELCDHEHWYTYILHYWHMPKNTYVCHITYSAHLYLTAAKYVPETNMPLICQIYAKYAITQDALMGWVWPYTWHIWNYWHKPGDYSGVHKECCMMWNVHIPVFMVTLFIAVTSYMSYTPT